ncbi:MAG: CapA family protein [Eubacterium sp.]|nr:CapA family protein [Eubacterium sp.]
MSNGNKRKLFEILIPALLAAVVFTGIALSGYVSKSVDGNADTTQPPTTQAPVETEPTEPAGSGPVTIVAVGDNLIHNTLVDAGQKDDGTADYTSFYEHIKKYISAADIAIINQETMLGGSKFPYAGYPCFNTPWEVGTAAIDAGFDIFTCATNHSLDVGFKGIEQECLFFDEHPEVTALGTYDTEEESKKITYYEEKGIKFALLNYTYGTNGIPLPQGKEWCVNMMDKERITQDVKTAKENADVVIMFPHWGIENTTQISSYQKEYVKLFSDLGVDIVIGCHPHVLQTVEWVENETTGKRMLVYYSLGNFISHQTSVDQLCGGMAEITLEKKNGEVSINSAKLAPLVCWYSKSGSNYKFSVYKLSEYTDSLASTHLQRSKGATPDYYTKHAKDVIPEEFLDLS